jgi:hypothetical protein
MHAAEREVFVLFHGPVFGPRGTNLRTVVRRLARPQASRRTRTFAGRRLRCQPKRLANNIRGRYRAHVLDMQRGRDRQGKMTTPTEQPPRKLSGTRTAPQERSGERRFAPTEGDLPPHHRFTGARETLRYMDRWGIGAGSRLAQ